jgi:flavin-dependent dehydrogenase
VRASASSADVVIIGAGPAGCAAGISAAQAGLNAVIIERLSFPRHRPGETLPPGVEPLFRQLGVWEEIERADFVRHCGHRVAWRGASEFSAFGNTDGTPWLGFQAWRPRLDAILLRRAATLGVKILQPCRARAAMVAGDRITGVVTDRGEIRSRYLIDASGGRGWLARNQKWHTDCRSPQLIASYGYVRTRHAAEWHRPELRSTDEGWLWEAQIAPHVVAWTRLSFCGPRFDVPRNLTSLSDSRRLSIGASSADVTWRLTNRAAGPGWFLAGDAALTLDPASSHGVLRGLMTGIMASHLIGRVTREALSPDGAAETYQSWIRNWFDHDVANLQTFYRRLPSPPEWLARKNTALHFA